MATTWEAIRDSGLKTALPKGTPGRAGRAELVDTSRARAYCGAAHGLTWELDRDSDPPDVIDLPVEGARASYRLVYNPRTGRRARDHHGNYLYVPVRQRRSLRS